MRYLLSTLLACITFDAAAVPFPGATCNGSANDTAAIQAAINAKPSFTEFSMEGKTCVVSAPIVIPNGSQYLTITRTNFRILGDSEFLKGVGLVRFFKLEDSQILATEHTMQFRKLITYSTFANSTFSRVWSNGTAGKTIHYYANGNGGSGSYYNKWDGCYLGNMQVGIMADDGAVSATANSNMVTASRIQPGLGNIGVYLGNNSQQFTILGNQFESPGGIGIYLSGTGHSITSNRFEGLTYSMSVHSTAVTNQVGFNYYSGSPINWTGSSFNANCKANGGGC